ncbi:hypothetical protein DL991_42490 [Amycolatopsis sp. WAC 01375]|uniref:hypothetical protein n=1 Tax=unclassified Amycolatopsis TaxID=2618356 RepID=UPI000F770D40|nr:MULTISPECIES: hypothetical protein [unclassified Amycolatopsis]RSM58796.1 hypothetical protein DMH03_23080 [Amycolatopsis sp. WAC 01376]RSM68010.1 hypothetical protein DL991_42490 [Amycolatopsis sp. WAC 01375]RSN25008.1 hypothetical protein DL990_34600 [Amycolatopsis sp. WAC 01416]
MRHRQVLAVATVALFGLSGCADRPNDLDTYYDDPAPTPTVEPAQPSVKPQAAPVPPSSTRAPVPAAVSAALLTDEDVVEEEVVPGESKVSGCLTGLTRATSRSATWSYPSGSTLEHQVTEYTDRDASDVVAQADCEGKKLTLTKQAGVEIQRAWCEGTTCTVLLAKGKLVSALSVTAGTEARATDAAKRLLPIVAQRLRSA